MFEKRRARRAQEQYQREIADWEASVTAAKEFVDIARGYEGGAANPANLMLKKQETIFATVTDASLVEDRSSGGSWGGRSSGFSIPVAAGVRYRVGASRGHYVKAPPVPTAIDTGIITITNQRVVFQGSKQTRECAFTKMLGYNYASDHGGITIGVSNRQKPTTIRYGPALAAWFALRFELALAHFNGTVDQFVASVERELARVEQARPVPPALMAGSTPEAG